MEFDFDDFPNNDQIDLTPVIDVLFLLLIFFIMTTTFAKPVINVLLPEAQSAEEARQREEMMIVIDDAGTIFHENRQVSRDDLAILMRTEKKLPINFQVDKKAPFNAVMLVLDQARLHGRTDFTFTTNLEKKEKDVRQSAQTQ